MSHNYESLWTQKTLKVLIEYSVYIEEKTTVDAKLLKETERKIIGADKMDEIVKFTILIKLNCLKTTLEKEDLSVLENIIRYLRNDSPLKNSGSFFFASEMTIFRVDFQSRPYRVAL